MNAIGDLLLAADVRPFAVAAGIVLVLGGIEALAMLVGFSFSDIFGGKEVDFGAKDVHAETNSEGFLGGLFLWFNAGRLPLLILLILTLGLFSILGFFIQGIAHGTGVAVPAWAAGLLAAAWTVPMVRTCSRFIARILPRDETYAVDEADFVGHVGEVSVGPLDQGLPGRVRLKDVFGNWHTVAARARDDSDALPVGASVLLVGRDARSFVAVAASSNLISQKSKGSSGRAS
jgi:membrane protein implicated in regulation of membrane protease activity